MVICTRNVQWLSVNILLSQQDYDKESVFKQSLKLKDCHIQANVRVHIIPWIL